MFECVIRSAVPRDRYALHQRVAQLMSRDGKQRDYLYAVQSVGDSEHDALLYLRSAEQRAVGGEWKPMVLPQCGRTYEVCGQVYLDFSKSRNHYVVRDEQTGQITRHKGTRASAPMTQAGAQARMLRLISAMGDVRDCLVEIGETEVLTKGRGKALRINPILVRATVFVTDADAALQIATQGIGKGRGFGFGALHFVELKS